MRSKTEPKPRQSDASRIFRKAMVVHLPILWAAYACMAVVWGLWWLLGWPGLIVGIAISIAIQRLGMKAAVERHRKANAIPRRDPPDAIL